MRDMFDSYSNLSDIYVPDNITNHQDTFVRFSNSEINKEYNIKGDFVGYSWNYGDTVSLGISMSKRIMVEEDAIIYEESGQHPDSSTIGIKGQRAYNTKEIRSWTCETLDQTDYNWAEDIEFKYPEFGNKEIFENDNEKKVLFEIKNFRKENVYSSEIPYSGLLRVDITKEIAEILLKGVYGFYFTLVGENSSNMFMMFSVTIKDSNNNIASVVDKIPLGAEVVEAIEVEDAQNV